MLLRQSEYFEEFLKGSDAYKDFFISLDKDEGFENVVRPRSSDLFQEMDISIKKNIYGAPLVMIKLT